MLTPTNIAWVAGIIEGEGWIGLQQKKYPSINLSMTDRDIVERIAAFFGVRPRGPYKGSGPNLDVTYKQTYSCQVNGTRAVSWMLTLYTFFGSRRREAVEKVLAKWKANGSYRRSNATKAPRGSTTPAKCHPDRPNRANGMCKECYMKAYRKTYIRKDRPLKADFTVA